MPTTHAVVIGGSLAGLLAARVMSDVVDQVTIIDRDTWDDAEPWRAGVPHGRQVHGLLARGRAEIESLLPGVTQELVDAGAHDGDMQSDFPWSFGGVRVAQAETGIRALALSRSLLERTIRRRVLALPNVQLYQDCAVRGLWAHAGVVRGVVVDDRRGSSMDLSADWVVDASGRTSAAPKWLEQLGYPAVDTAEVPMDIVYSSRRFLRTPGQPGGRMGMAFSWGPQDRYSGLALAQEGDTWVIGVTGRMGRRVPLDLPSFTRYAAHVGQDLGDLVAASVPLDDGSQYRFRSSRWRRYDRMPAMPARFLVIGDALCSFNPAFGQGMTVLAAQAGLLRRALAGDPALAARRFHADATTVIRVPWEVVVANDVVAARGMAALPVAGQARVRYLARLRRAAHHDPELAAAFLRVLNLVEPPSSLLTPAIAAKVLARGGQRVRTIPRAPLPREDTVTAHAG